MIGANFKWLPASNGTVPVNAVVGGQTASKEVLYIGRGTYDNSLTVGKIQPSHGCLYIPFNSLEQRLTTYEVLVDSPKSEY